MSNNKIYPVTRHSASELVNHMHSYLAETQKMETQLIHNNVGNDTILQARVNGGKFRKIVGLDKAVTLRFVEAPGVVNVEIGEAKWIDKAIVMTISMFVLWPLSITSGIGIYKQKKLLNDIIAKMDSYMIYTAEENANKMPSGFYGNLEVNSDGISCN